MKKGKFLKDFLDCAKYDVAFLKTVLTMEIILKKGNN